MARFRNFRRWFSAGKPKARRRPADPGVQRAVERLEGRSMLAITPTFSSGVLTLTYDPIANQQGMIEIEEFVLGATSRTEVSVYDLSTPRSYVFNSVLEIVVEVPSYDSPGVNNNSLTIKGISTDSDRIVIAGSGRTAAGRWSDEGGVGPTVNSVLLSVAGIDNLTVTAGGIINVSGSFTNDTNDASIRAIGQSVEDTLATPQTARITVAEAVPLLGVVPQPYLSSNVVEVVGASIDIYGDISATDKVSLRAGDGAPPASRSNLVLPFDITVTGSGRPVAGLVDLFSTKNIVQLQSSTIVAPRLVAVSNATKLAGGPDGPWMIDLGTATNDFDSVSLGMVAAPGDDADSGTEGRIGIRDIDDLTVADFGILSSTGQVTIETGGALTFAAPVKATGLVGRSQHSIASLPAAVMQLGDLGLDLRATATFDESATGDVSLAGRITINDTDPTALVTNSVQAAGAVTIAAGIFSPLAGATTLSGIEGVTIAAPIQVGGTKLDANSLKIQVFDHDLICLSDAGTITVSNVVGNNAVPFTLQATNIVSFDALDSVSIAGSVFAGTLYGDPGTLATTEALPAITIRTQGEINLAATGLLRTSAYETNFNGTTNPLVGLISLGGAERVNGDGTILADGALDVDVVGDVYLNGPSTARERISVRTSSGSISVAGRMQSTGATYTAAVPSDSPRVPNVILSALNGSISTGDAGALSAGIAVTGGTKTFGVVDLRAQQDINLDAPIDTVGAITATTSLGAFELSALLRTANGLATTISAGNGIRQTDADLARIVTDSLVLTNTGAGGDPSDIDLSAKNNLIKAVSALNLSTGGDVGIRNNAPLSIAGLIAQRDDLARSTVTLASTAGLTQTGPIQANDLVVSNASATAITLTNTQNNVDRFAASNTFGSVSYVDNDDFETGVVRGGPLPVEIRADSLSLSNVLPYSTVRVVSGLQYRTLSLAAGTSSGTSVGTVEFVTTSPTDNPATKAAFAGTLRDMVRYVNDNGASYVVNGTRRPQPMSIVFDEAGYLVEDITLAAALPAFVRPVTIAGSRLEATASATRLGIVGNAKIPSGLTFGIGSSGSTIDGIAAHGFSTGSAITLNSANNTITDTHVGLRADGTPSANRIGVTVAGTAAVGNLIGSTAFDAATANRVGGNTDAGILIRDGANGNRVFGNIIGAYDNGAGLVGAANGDGVRVFKATGNEIGSADATQLDHTGSLSNVIAGNTASGVRILNAVAGSYATANVVRNNLITANTGRPGVNGQGAGIAVQASKFAVIGGSGTAAGNSIVGQLGSAPSGHGISLSDSTDVRIHGNAIGVQFDGITVEGNAGDGVNVIRSQRVDIAAGNVIVGNKANGVAIDTGSTAVTVAGNRIGLLVDDTAAGNTRDGVAINVAVGNTIGAGNLIANNANGVSITNARGTAPQAVNRVIGSEIFANLISGVRIVGGSRTTIGGVATGEGNIIRNNAGDGIVIQSSPQTGAATGHLIQGNFIGTNLNHEVDESLGNAGSGIRIVDGVQNVVSSRNYVMNNQAGGVALVNGTANVIGGPGILDGNMIEANSGSGISIGVSSPASVSTGHRVYGNIISGNAEHGVDVAGAKVTGIWIGHDTTTTAQAGRGNEILGNGGAGVRVNAAQQVAVQGNRIANNVAAGIQLVNGANSSTSPVFGLTSAIRRQPIGSAPQVVVTGTLRGVALQQYSIDLYANPAAAGNGYQGNRFIGRLTVTADRNGLATFSFAVTADVVLGEFITGIATARRFGIGSTTTFSNGVQVVLPPPSPPRR